MKLLFVATAVAETYALTLSKSVRTWSVGVPQDAQETKTNVGSVVTLLTDLASAITKDGQEEQQAYDRYACWCENTMNNKTADIQHAEADIQQAQEKISELETATGNNRAEIQHLNTLIATLNKDLSDASAAREVEKKKAHEDGEEYRMAMEALDSAIQVMKAGIQKTAFLGALQQKQALRITDSLQKVLSMPAAAVMLSADDKMLMQKFFSKSVGGSTRLLSALQSVKEEDHSGIERVLGICTQMLEDFMSELERLHGEELEKETLHRNFQATKQEELSTSQETLALTEEAFAADKKTLAGTKELRDDTEEQLEADKTFSKRLTHDCQNKSVQWSDTSRFRTKTLVGITTAIGVLSHEVFSTSMFLQVSPVSVTTSAHPTLQKALKQLRSIVTAHPSLAQFTTGKKFAYFDEVVAAIDKMIKMLQVEEKADIAERDRCQNLNKATTDGIADDTTKIATSNNHLDRAASSKTELESTLAACEEEKVSIEKKVNESTTLRSLAESEFKATTQECHVMSAKLLEAIAIVKRAVHESNPARAGPEGASLLQSAQDPAYEVDEFKPPSADFDGLGSHADEKRGIVAILEMIHSDNTKRCEDLLSINKDEDSDYDALLVDAKKSFDEKSAICDEIQSQIVDLNSQVTEHQTDISNTEAAKAAKEATLEASKPACQWVESAFASRRDKRAAELSGLQDAKSYLSGQAPSAAAVP